MTAVVAAAADTNVAAADAAVIFLGLLVGLLVLTIAGFLVYWERSDAR